MGLGWLPSESFRTCFGSVAGGYVIDESWPPWQLPCLPLRSCVIYCAAGRPGHALGARIRVTIFSSTIARLPLQDDDQGLCSSPPPSHPHPSLMHQSQAVPGFGPPASEVSPHTWNPCALHVVHKAPGFLFLFAVILPPDKLASHLSL